MPEPQQPANSPVNKAAAAAASVTQKARDKAADVVKGVQDALAGVRIPGAPGSAPAPVDEPTEPREPLAPKPDQSPAAPFSPTGGLRLLRGPRRAQHPAYVQGGEEHRARTVAVRRPLRHGPLSC